MTTPWTPGPWLIDKDDIDDTKLIVQSSEVHGMGDEVIWAHDYDLESNRPADLALAALAPEMAETIMAVRDGWNASGGECCGEDGTNMLMEMFKKLDAIGVKV